MPTFIPDYPEAGIPGGAYSSGPYGKGYVAPTNLQQTRDPVALTAGLPAIPGLSGLLPGLGAAATSLLPAIGAGSLGAGLASLLGWFGNGGGGGGGGDVSELGEGGGLPGAFPWETPTGEGMIAPWTPQYQLPTGKWGQVGQWYQGQMGMNLPGFQAIKSWHNGAKDGSTPATVQFFLSADGRVASIASNGKWAVWRPKKHIVISSNPRISHIRKLDRVHKRVQKTLRKYQPRRGSRSGTLASDLLSPAERKLLARGG